MNLIGQAIFLSMDIPDAVLGVSLLSAYFLRGWRLTSVRVLKFSKLLNYMQRKVAKTYAFAGLIVAWSYFRIYLSLKILWSIWFEFDLIPYVAHPFLCTRSQLAVSRAGTMQWAPETGAWLAWWMKYQIFAPLFFLQVLNVFWYFLILRIAFRYVGFVSIESS